MTGISYLNYYMLEECMSADEYIQKYGNIFVDESFKSLKDFAKLFSKNTGIKNISICQSPIFEMFKTLIKKYFADTLTPVENIKYIIFTDEVLLQEESGYIAYIIKDYFEMINAVVILIDQHCSSTTLAIGILSRLVNSGEVALVLSSCKIEKMENRFVGYSIKGDAVGIAEIRTSNYFLGIKDYNFTSCSNLKLANGRDNVIINGINNINMLLKKNDLTIESVDKVIPQNVNKTAYEYLYTRFLKCEKKKFFLDNVSRGGHLGDVDTIANIKDFTEREDYQRIIVYSIGAFKNNYNYNSLLLEKVGEV